MKKDPAVPADITLVNLNMLFLRYGEEIERELHVPLGPLYLTRALEDAGYRVDFRDYQCVESDDPFDMEVFLDFLSDPAPVIGLSCMANLLPFTVLAIRALRERYPDRKIVLGGVGAKAVETQLLSRFPWIDLICRGEAERTGPELLGALRSGGNLEDIAGLSLRIDAHANVALRSAKEGEIKRNFRGAKGDIPMSALGSSGHIIHTANRERIVDLDSIPFPAFEKIDLKRYAGYGMMTSRGCPYPCTFCSVAPVWNLESHSRGAKNIVDEMDYLHRRAGVDLFLFQDEFFVSGKRQVVEFCDELRGRRLPVQWKAFGRVNLVDEEMMRAMAETGCVELRFGIESGSDRILQEIKKGFTAAQALEVVPKAVGIFPRVDAFFVWGFPFETMDDFHQSLFQMVSFRMLGARILPSLLSLLPQTEIYRDWAPRAELEFCPYLFPEFVFTGHEICRHSHVELPERYREYFDLIRANSDIFSGFFHIDLERNVLPKLALLRQFGFYPEPQPSQTSAESCGAHSPHFQPQELATRVSR
jgi:anaerobic magnesium-protoporphyrin IX monomethyl ester cyclase